MGLVMQPRYGRTGPSPVWVGAGWVAELCCASWLRDECAGGDFEASDFDPEPLAGGSCSTGRGVVCARADDASLERTGCGGAEPGGTTVTPGVELVAGLLPDDEGADDARLVSRVADDDESDGRDDTLLEEDELKSVFRLESFGGDLPQSVLPLEAAFCES